MAETFYRPCWVDIDLGALRHNLRELRRQLASKTQILAVVKANGYGHGLVPAARTSVKSGASLLGVSSLEEGIALRQGGVNTPALVLGSLYPFDGFPVLF